IGVVDVVGTGRRPPHARRSLRVALLLFDVELVQGAACPVWRTGEQYIYCCVFFYSRQEERGRGFEGFSSPTSS
ncbi:hypothetical protein A2U01_0040678, partial [Trifolium medium]|nr:hypothetical protein [Trifolium medium]